MYYNKCLIALTAMLGFGLPLRHTLLMHGERQRRIALALYLDNAGCGRQGAHQLS